MGLALGITQAALKELSTPALGLPIRMTAAIEAMGSPLALLKPSVLVTGLPIYPSAFSEKGTVQIGTQVIVTTIGGTDGTISSTTMIDNVAPQPRRWTVEGYLAQFSDSQGDLLMQANNSPALRYATAALAPVTTSVYLAAAKQYIRYLKDARCPFKFRTDTGSKETVILADYEFVSHADITNAQHVKLSLVEYVALSATLPSATDASGYSSSELTTAAQNVPSWGTLFGNPVFTSTLALTLAGRAVSVADVTRDALARYWEEQPWFGAGITNWFKTLSEDAKALVERAMGDIELIDPTKVFSTIFNSDLFLFTATWWADALIKFANSTSSSSHAEEVVLETIGGNSFVLLPALYTNDSVFAGIKSTNDRNVDVYLDHIATSIQFDANSLQLTLRKNFWDGAWWVAIDGTVNGVSISRYVRLVYYTQLLPLHECYIVFTTRAWTAESDMSLDDLDGDAVYEAIAQTGIIVGIPNG